mgnify:CR=1 FL=1
MAWQPMQFFWVAKAGSITQRLSRLPVEQALADYQTSRAPRAARIVAAANGNAKSYHLSGLTRSLAHTGLRIGGALAPGLALRKFDWLYDFDVTVE